MWNDSCRRWYLKRKVREAKKLCLESKKWHKREQKIDNFFRKKYTSCMLYSFSLCYTHTWTLKWMRKFRYSQWGKCWLMLFIKSKSIFTTPIISYTNKLWSTPIHIIFTIAVTCREGICRNDDKNEFSFWPHQSCCFNLCIVEDFVDDHLYSKYFCTIWSKWNLGCSAICRQFCQVSLDAWLDNKLEAAGSILISDWLLKRYIKFI